MARDYKPGDTYPIPEPRRGARRVALDTLAPGQVVVLAAYLVANETAGFELTEQTLAIALMAVSAVVAWAQRWIVRDERIAMFDACQPSAVTFASWVGYRASQAVDSSKDQATAEPHGGRSAATAARLTARAHAVRSGACEPHLPPSSPRSPPS